MQTESFDLMVRVNLEARFENHEVLLESIKAHLHLYAHITSPDFLLNEAEVLAVISLEPLD